MHYFSKWVTSRLSHWGSLSLENVIQFNVTQNGLQTFCSNCVSNSTVVSLQPSPPSALHCLTFQPTAHITHILKDLPPTLNAFFWAVSFSMICLLALNQPFTSFSRQISLVIFDTICFSLSNVWWATSCSTQTCTSCYSVVIFNQVQITTTWLLPFLSMVLLNLWCLSSEVSGMLQPGFSWSSNNVSSGIVSGCQCIILLNIEY